MAMNFGSLFGPMLGQHDTIGINGGGVGSNNAPRAGLLPPLPGSWAATGVRPPTTAADAIPLSFGGPRPNPIPSQIGSAIGSIFGNAPKPAPMAGIGDFEQKQARPMQLPNYGGMSRPPMAKPIAGVTPVPQAAGTPQWGHAGWLARGKKAR